MSFAAPALEFYVETLGVEKRAVPPCGLRASTWTRRSCAKAIPSCTGAARSWRISADVPGARSGRQLADGGINHFTQLVL
jgi:hypothetical protein